MTLFRPLRSSTSTLAILVVLWGARRCIAALKVRSRTGNRRIVRPLPSRRRSTCCCPALPAN